LVGSILSVAEMLATFAAQIDLQRQLPNHEISADAIEVAVVEKTHDGLLSDILLHMMYTILEDGHFQGNYEGLATPLKWMPLNAFTVSEVIRQFLELEKRKYDRTRYPNWTKAKLLAGRRIERKAKAAVAAATKAAAMPPLLEGATEEQVTEAKAALAAIIAANADATYAQIDLQQWERAESEQYRTEVFPLIDVLGRLQSETVFALEPEVKLKLLDYLCVGLLTKVKSMQEQGKVREAIEDVFEEVKTLKRAWNLTRSTDKQQQEARDEVHSENIKVITANYKAGLETLRPGSSAAEGEAGNAADALSPDVLSPTDVEGGLGELNDKANEKATTIKAKMEELKTTKRAAMQKEEDRHKLDEEIALGPIEVREKVFRDAVRDKCLLVRAEPLGYDRYHRRYYIFQSVRGVMVEPPLFEALPEAVATGIPPPSALHSAAPTPAPSAAPSGTSTPIMEGASTAAPTAVALMGDATAAATDAAAAGGGGGDAMDADAINVTTTIPTNWTRYTAKEDIDALLESLHERGLRENGLRATIALHRDRVDFLPPFKRLPNPSTKDATVVLPKTAKEMVVELEQRLMQGHMCNLSDRYTWGRAVEKASTPQALGQCILQLEEAIARKSFEVPKNRQGARFYLEEEPELEAQMAKLAAAEAAERAAIAAWNAVNAPVQPAGQAPDDGEQMEEEDELPEGYYYINPAERMSRIKRWQTMTAASVSMAQIFVSIEILTDAINWSKSTAKARCKVCKKGTDAEKLLLCDKCDDGYHMFCLKPKLKKIPADDWFCCKCQPTIPRKRQRIEPPRDEDGDALGEDEVGQLEVIPAAKKGKNNSGRATPTGRGTPVVVKPEKKRKQPAAGQVEEVDMDDDYEEEVVPTTNIRRRTTIGMDLSLEILKALQRHPKAGYFLEPVKKKDVPKDYFTIIKQPMDLQTMRQKLDLFAYETVQAMIDDLNLIWKNSVDYNGPRSEIGTCAMDLQRYIEERYGARSREADTTDQEADGGKELVATPTKGKGKGKAGGAKGKGKAKGQAAEAPEPAAKRGPGRPKKSDTVAEPTPSPAAAAKRGSGRSKKADKPPPQASSRGSRASKRG
jgi:hypothetical protein